jgi:FkbM family methyltransferase
MQTIGIIDVIGLTYDGDTLSKRGLGGSESAVILMSKELAKLGFDVTVLNNANDKESTEGVFDGVKFVDLKRLHEPNDYKFDIVISSRTIIPFLQEKYHGLVNYPPSVFMQIKKHAKHKIVWLHDTFCTGDWLLEEHAMNGDFDELFTLSDFHTSYITNCDHGARRNFEVLKNKVFITRNGAVQHIKNVDISKKDKNLFVYNASVTKGMIPLVEEIWPKVKERIPDAKLKIIGGFYRFREELGPDEQENKFWELYKRPVNKELGIEFTGIIKQKEIAGILADASYFIFPGAFPETFGISSVEALIHNTPLLSCRFGAVEETGLEQASYFIDYAIEPNSLFPNINRAEQVDKFVEMVVKAYNNPYLHQQKMYYCNIIKDIAGWDSVALQWKQHLYKKLKLHLSVDEYRKVKQINFKVHKSFGRRFSNPEEWAEPKSGSEQHISIVSPFYNAADYIEKCILSVASQDYNNYTHWLIDDASTDNSYEIAKNTIDSLPEKLRDKFILKKNYVNQGAVRNQIETIRALKGDDIIMLLDGDDWLFHDNDILDFYNNQYADGAEYTYGSCWSLADNIPLVAQPYPQEVLDSRKFREHKFNWGIPYTHLRTFRKNLLDNLNNQVFKDENGEWFRAGGDVATFYNIIEQAKDIRTVSRIVYVYNDMNPLNDYKINSHEQTKNAHEATRRNTTIMLPQKSESSASRKKTILIGIPTAKYIESETFKSIYDMIVPDGYEVDFQCFYGYNIDQVRNLIASWAERYDYLFSVDSDIAFEKDTLVKMLQHDKDMVTGLYIQRKPGQHILELYRAGQGNIPYEDIYGKGLVEVDGCGFGCVLVKSEVIRAIGYPQFVYKSALNHNDTISEDVYFCTKAREKGFKIYADTSIICRHIGATQFLVTPPTHVPQSVETYSPPVISEAITNHLKELSKQDLVPQEHIDYLYAMNIKPKVIYDIGACVLHWTKKAKDVWPTANYFAFDAMEAAGPIFAEAGIPYCIGALSDSDFGTVEFYENQLQPGGNSYYKENSEASVNADLIFSEANKKTMPKVTLKRAVDVAKWPKPNLIKMDVQGAELDILKGAGDILSECEDIILEMQHIEYNKGAPLKDEVIAYLEKIGYKMVGTGAFSDNGPDGDYHFKKVS